MSHAGEQLDPEAQMVLYIAGELTNGQKAAFERQLAEDPKLSAELTKLRETQVFCAESLRAGDESIRLPVSEGVALRRVSRAMSQWQVDRARMAPMPVGRNRLIPVWSYPVAAAAMLIIGFLIWSSRQPIGLPAAAPDGVAQRNTDDQPDLTPDQQPPQSDSQNALADWIDNSFGNAQEAVNTESAFSPTPELPGAAADENAGPIFPAPAPAPEETVQ